MELFCQDSNEFFSTRITYIIYENDIEKNMYISTIPPFIEKYLYPKILSTSCRIPTAYLNLQLQQELILVIFVY